MTTLYDNYYIASNREYVSLRPVPADRSVQLRVPQHAAGLGGALPVPGRPADLVLGHVASRQQRRASTRARAEILPIDAHPRPIYRLDGQPWRGRIQTYDAPFTLQKADSFTLHVNSQPSYIRGQAAQPLFDDSRSYFDPAMPTGGVKVPNTDIRIRVLSESGTSMRIRIAPS